MTDTPRSIGGLRHADPYPTNGGTPDRHGRREPRARPELSRLFGGRRSTERRTPSGEYRISGSKGAGGGWRAGAPGGEEAAREAYRLAIAQAEEAHDAAPVVPLAALREAEHAREAARVHSKQVNLEADHAWLDAVAGDEAGKEAGIEASKAMREAAGAAFREAREAERAARAHYQEIAAQASTTLYATRAAALAELNRFHEAASRAENNQRHAIRDAFAKDVPLQEAIAAYETARAVAGDAYIAAYEKPTPDTWRDTAGYSRTVILKMAVSERQLCPD